MSNQYQYVFKFIIDTLKGFISTCRESEVLSWCIYIFVLGVIISVFSFLWKK